MASDMAVLEEDDLVSALEGGAAVGNDKAGRPGSTVGQAEEPFPEQPLGVDVQGAGEIVKAVELRPAQEGTGGGRALQLATGKAHPFGAEQSLVTSRHGRQVLF